jgi:hypothetical protein
MPTEAIDGLPAHTAAARPLCVFAFAIWRRRRPERAGQSPPTVAEPPSPAAGRSAASRKGPREAIGAEWMGAPIRFDCKPRRRRHEGAVERSRQNARWKDGCQAIADFSPPSGRPNPTQDSPCLLASCNRRSKVFVINSTWTAAETSRLTQPSVGLGVGNSAFGKEKTIRYPKVDASAMPTAMQHSNLTSHLRRDFSFPELHSLEVFWGALEPSPCRAVRIACWCNFLLQGNSSDEDESVRHISPTCPGMPANGRFRAGPSGQGDLEPDGEAVLSVCRTLRKSASSPR